MRGKRIDGYVVATNMNKVLPRLQDSLIACVIPKWTSYAKGGGSKNVAFIQRQTPANLHLNFLKDKPLVSHMVG